jgi:hypothetical protein
MSIYIEQIQSISLNNKYTKIDICSGALSRGTNRKRPKKYLVMWNLIILFQNLLV